MKRIIFGILFLITSLNLFAQIVNEKDFNFTKEQKNIITHSYYNDVPFYVGRLCDNIDVLDGVFFCRGMGPHFHFQLFLIYSGETIFFKRKLYGNPKVIIGEMCQIIQNKNIQSEDIRQEIYKAVYKIIMEDKRIWPKEYNLDNVDMSDIDRIYNDIKTNPDEIPYKLPWGLLLDMTSDESYILLGKICGLNR
jgi:hypothetical protein